MDRLVINDCQKSVVTYFVFLDKVKYSRFGRQSYQKAGECKTPGGNGRILGNQPYFML